MSNQTGDPFREALELARARRRLPPPARRRLVRESAGISQSDLARSLGVNASVVCRWESGARTPGGRHLTSYLEALERLAREAAFS
jgi:DNA-binding transcriptional regulator YiaG